MEEAGESLKGRGRTIEEGVKKQAEILAKSMRLATEQMRENCKEGAIWDQKALEDMAYENAARETAVTMHRDGEYRAHVLNLAEGFGDPTTEVVTPADEIFDTRSIGTSRNRRVYRNGLQNNEGDPNLLAPLVPLHPPRPAAVIPPSD